MPRSSTCALAGVLGQLPTHSRAEQPNENASMRPDVMRLLPQRMQTSRPTKGELVVFVLVGQAPDPSDRAREIDTPSVE
jgi:hypothetical protein